jgi:predicted MFS family arabinose efflux permease
MDQMPAIPRKWQIAFMLFGIAALNYGDRTAIASVFPLLRADLGLSDLVLAGIGSAFLWAYAIGSPIAGYMADRVSRSRLVLFSLVAWSSVMFVTSFVQSGPVLIFTRVLLGLAECAYLPAAIALIAEHHEPNTRGTAMGLHNCGLQLGLIAGSGIAGYLGQQFGWRIDFIVLGGAGLLLALLASFILRDGPVTGPPASSGISGLRDVGQLMRIPGYVAVISGAMLIAVGTWIFLNWLPLYFHERFHLSLAGAGLSSSAMLQIAGIIGVLLGGFISDRTAGGSPKRRLLLLAICYFCAAPLLLTFGFNAGLGAIYASIFFYSFLKSLGSASECPIICEVAGPRLRSTGLGILNMLNCTAGGIGIMWAGVLKRDYGLATAFTGVSGTVAIAGVLVLLGYFKVALKERRTTVKRVSLEEKSGMLDDRSEEAAVTLDLTSRS